MTLVQPIRLFSQLFSQMPQFLLTLAPAAGVLSVVAAPAAAFDLTAIGTYSTGVFDQGAAEISAYDPATQRLFVTNGSTGQIDVLGISNPTAPSLLFNIALSEFGSGANSIAFQNGILAAAVEAEVTQDPGSVVFFNADGDFLNSVTVGALPDMLTFTPDGSKVLVANEGEPNDDYTIDPEGSVSIVDISGGIDSATATTAGFTQFNDQLDALIASGVRIFGPGATVAQDLEPEYITVSEDSTRAWVSLQENNALGILNLETGVFEDIVALGFKDHSLPENSLDASDRDDAINITTYENLFGLYQPDVVAAYTVGDATYIVTANEGDARDYDGFSEEERVSDLTLDPTAFPDAAALQADAALGRLTVTNTLGDTDGDGDFDQLYVFGGRSFSILDAEGNLIFDSGDEFERILAERLPDFFNSDHTENSFDSRSDAKGPEPEGVAIATIADRTYAFIGLERIGGVMVYDISNPTAPTFVDYVNNRNFAVEFNEDVFGDVNEDGDPVPTLEQLLAVGDLGPEGVLFIAAEDSPNRAPLLVLTNEVSGSTTIYAIDAADSTEVPEPLSVLALLLVTPLGWLTQRKRGAHGSKDED